MDLSTTERRTRRLGIVVALVAVVGVGLLVSIVVSPADDDRPAPTPTVATTTSTTSVTSLPAIVIRQSMAASDRWRIEASGVESSPWVTMEVCASAPPGCAPLWVYSLEQDGFTTVAEVRRPTGFIAPDGVRHDCGVEACELRVSTEDSIEITPVPAPSGLAEPAPGPVVDDGLVVAVFPEPIVDGTETTVAVNWSTPNARISVGLCAERDLDDRCTVVHVGRADDQGVGRFVGLRLPRQVSGVAETAAGVVRTETDCATQPCRLVVTVDGARADRPVAYDDTVPRAAGEVTLDPVGPYAPGEAVIVRGSGFDVVSPTRAAAARWVICEERPLAVHRLGEVCGSPRTPRGATVRADGTFELPVRVPAPGSVRTWIDAEPIECIDECWLAVLTGPFFHPVSVPIRVEAPAGR